MIPKYDEITLNIFPYLNEFLEYEDIENLKLHKYLNKKFTGITITIQ